MANHSSSIRITGSASFSVNITMTTTVHRTPSEGVSSSRRSRLTSSHSATPSTSSSSSSTEAQGLSRDKISALPLKRVKSEQAQRKITCSVCLDEFRVDQTMKVLACKHNFHSKCIDKWLIKRNTCPMCRHPVIVKERNRSSSHSNGHSRSISRRYSTTESTMTVRVRSTTSSISASTSDGTIVHRVSSSNNGHTEMRISQSLSQQRHATTLIRTATTENIQEQQQTMRRVTRSASRRTQYDQNRMHTLNEENVLPEANEF